MCVPYALIFTSSQKYFAVYRETVQPFSFETGIKSHVEQKGESSLDFDFLE